MTLFRTLVMASLLAATSLAADWNPKLAEQYLDQRQKEWNEWPNAKRAGGPCLSCHTGLGYVLARPALRRALGETGVTGLETTLLQGVRARSKATVDLEIGGIKGGASSVGAQAVLAAVVLSFDDKSHSPTLRPETEDAFNRLWALQIQDGADKGAWAWTSLNLDPWEDATAIYYGAALAAVATATAPGNYQARPEIQDNVAALKAYLKTKQQTQPLHNRLLAVWAANRLPGILSAEERSAILAEAWRTQETDGGWSNASVGPWKEHPAAPAAPGSTSYATAVAAFTLQQAGVKRSDPRLVRALAWLKAHQDAQTGSWAAVSMNHEHKADTMPASFMRDAATAYAVLALLPAAE